MTTPCTESEDRGYEENIVGDGKSDKEAVERFSEIASGQNSDRQCVPYTFIPCQQKSTMHKSSFIQKVCIPKKPRAPNVEDRIPSIQNENA